MYFFLSLNSRGAGDYYICFLDDLRLDDVFLSISLLKVVHSSFKPR
jgi:hypothetical protein